MQRSESLVCAPGIYSVKNLRRLRLARNAITDVPEDLGWLKKLELLDLSDNDLRSLPACLHLMDKLTSFNVKGNHNISRVRLPDEEEADRDRHMDHQMTNKVQAHE
jgi:Leucine-rich repeat (LRR) protein